MIRLIRDNWLGILVGITACAVAYMGVNFVYAVKVQPDPQVIRKLEPMTNTGVDARGLTLDAWVKAGNVAEAYRPVPKTTFKPGETFWTLRQDCFVNKVSDGRVFRALLGGDRRDKNGDLDLTRQTGSQYILESFTIPTRSDGCPVKNHPTILPGDVPAQVWTYAAGVDFFKSPQQPSVRVHFRPVVITVVAK